MKYEITVELPNGKILINQDEGDQEYIEEARKTVETFGSLDTLTLYNKDEITAIPKGLLQNSIVKFRIL